MTNTDSTNTNQTRGSKPGDRSGLTPEAMGNVPSAVDAQLQNQARRMEDGGEKIADAVAQTGEHVAAAVEDPGAVWKDLKQEARSIAEAVGDGASDLGDGIRNAVRSGKDSSGS
jgi:hypothetical protein